MGITVVLGDPNKDQFGGRFFFISKVNIPVFKLKNLLSDGIKERADDTK